MVIQEMIERVVEGKEKAKANDGVTKISGESRDYSARFAADVGSSSSISSNTGPSLHLRHR